eukprot:819573-Ditylum_brightwellii.AAC.1
MGFDKSLSIGLNLFLKSSLVIITFCRVSTKSSKDAPYFNFFSKGIPITTPNVGSFPAYNTSLVANTVELEFLPLCVPLFVVIEEVADAAVVPNALDVVVEGHKIPAPTVRRRH